MRYSTAMPPFAALPYTLRRLASAAMLFLLVSGLSGCAGAGQSGGSSQTLTINQVIKLLRDHGLSVTPGRRLPVNYARDALVLNTSVGDNLRVYEFPSSIYAAMTISRKSPSAGSPPFYYQKGNIMLTHAGNSTKVERVLKSRFTPKRRR
ncbi:MAG: hypothetical protein ABEL04_00960 [Salinibacter sp.]|uniref:hypothetical protein n=1 Tax=Salinibacter sp. TaxID=2065818 RepID=UPI0035D50FEF